MREGEILGLRHEDLSLDTSTLQVTQTVYNIRGKTYIGEPKSDKSRHTIALPDYVIEVLRSVEPGSGLLFTTSSGRPVFPRNLLRHFHESLANANLPRDTFHSLRHLHANYLLKRNIDSKIVQERLGRSSISLTMDTYSHVLPDIQKEAVEKIDDIFYA